MEHNIYNRIHTIYSLTNDIYIDKHSKYGLSWLNFEYVTITDKCLGKIHKIKTVHNNYYDSLNTLDIKNELLGIINYSKKYLYKLTNTNEITTIISVVEYFTELEQTILNLYVNKNNHYDNIWMRFRLISIIDGIYGRINRIMGLESDIENNKKIITENYYDIINECCFLYIRLFKD